MSSTLDVLQSFADAVGPLSGRVNTLIATRKIRKRDIIDIAAEAKVVEAAAEKLRIWAETKIGSFGGK